MPPPRSSPADRTPAVKKTQVIFLKPAIFAAVQATGPYSETVAKSWGKIFDWLDDTKPDPMPDRGFGLTFDDPRTVAASDLRYAAGVTMPSNWSAPETGDIGPLKFGGGSFLRTRVVGPYTNTGKVISALRDQWIPKNGLVLDRCQPVLTIYLSDTRYVDPDDQVADVCLPVFADRRSKPRDPS